MSATSMIREVTEISRGYSWTIDDLHDVARNAIMSAFISEDEKQDIYSRQIKSVFTELGAK
jgi:adenosine deaminase